jgi:conflict system pore-forming effector with SLATT domain
MVYGYAVGQAQDAEQWYATKRKPKRIGGQILRITAIVLFGVAALVPVLAEVLSDGGKPGIAPAWSSVALVLAASLVALDRYFGFSTGWTRFVAADLQIGRLRRDFEFAWHELEVAANDPEEIPLRRLELAHRFVAAVDRVVAEETSAWSDEFRAVLDSAMKELSQKQHDGS